MSSQQKMKKGEKESCAFDKAEDLLVIFIEYLPADRVFIKYIWALRFSNKSVD